MSTFPIYDASQKDSNANFLNRIRDASDVTTMVRQQAIRRSYQLLRNNGSPVQGGIPHSDLYDMAHTVGSYAPMNSLQTNVSFTSCVPCSGIPFSPLKVSLSFVRY